MNSSLLHIYDQYIYALVALGGTALEWHWCSGSSSVRAGPAGYAARMAWSRPSSTSSVCCLA